MKLQPRRLHLRLRLRTLFLFLIIIGLLLDLWRRDLDERRTRARLQAQLRHARSKVEAAELLLDAREGEGLGRKAGGPGKAPGDNPR
jgi:hypothetical protein